MDIRLIREVSAPTGSGPGNGMYVLQRALREHGPEWLHVGGMLSGDDIPWFWCWYDIDLALACADSGQPFIIGPNMVFLHWDAPTKKELRLLNAGSLRLQFTESDWYRRLIAEDTGPELHAPTAVWPYPIEPVPGPVEPEFDLLVYQKSGPASVARKLMRRFPNSLLISYGRYARDELLSAARRSRVCAYLSDNDRGPLALGEIMLSGCPAVGTERGAPWVNELTGVRVPELTLTALEPAIVQLRDRPRERVRAWALEHFDGRRVVGQIVEAIEAIRRPRP